jgi:TrpR-related protein YerC/YecD
LAYRSRFGDAGLDRLFDGILCLRSREDCYRFFEDLCTVGELRAMAQRLQVADLLRRGTTYEEIARLTGMSSATVSRIKRFLLYGADGYRRVLERLDAGEADAGDEAAAAAPTRAAAAPTQTTAAPAQTTAAPAQTTAAPGGAAAASATDPPPSAAPEPRPVAPRRAWRARGVPDR